MTKHDRAKLDHRVVEQLGHARDIWSIQDLVAREVDRAVRVERKRRHPSDAATKRADAELLKDYAKASEGRRCGS